MTPRRTGRVKRPKLSATERAVRQLARKIKDRERAMWHPPGTILLIDDGGGEPITSFDDATACHYFLRWLRDERAETARQWKIAARRRQIRSVA